MNSSSISKPTRVIIFIALLVCGLLVFVFGTNYFSIFATNDSQAYRGILAIIFLAAALILRRNESLEPYSQIAYAFFTAILVFFVASLVAPARDAFFHAINVQFNTPFHLALAKVSEASLAIVVILLLNRLWGQDLGSLYIKKGRLGLSLFIGLCLFTLNAATGVVTGATLGIDGEQLIAQLPWAIVFSLANGLMEEIWFRGLFLRRFAKVIGMPASIVVSSIVFTVSHVGATYMNPIEAVLFQAIILPMALLLAYLMHKTDNVWGATLYHAGSDVFIFYLTVM